MSQDCVNLMVTQLETIKRVTLDVIQKVPEDRRLRQAAPGKAHSLWLVGHLALTTDVVGGSFVLGQAPRLGGKYGLKFAPDFFHGDPITSIPENYPEWDGVVEDYVGTFDHFIGMVKDLTDADLSTPARGPVPERLKALITTVGAGITLTIVHHAHHRGQIALLSNLPD